MSSKQFESQFHSSDPKNKSQPYESQDSNQSPEEVIIGLQKMNYLGLDTVQKKSDLALNNQHSEQQLSLRILHEPKQEPRTPHLQTLSPTNVSGEKPDLATLNQSPTQSKVVIHHSSKQYKTLKPPQQLQSEGYVPSQITPFSPQSHSGGASSLRDEYRTNTSKKTTDKHSYIQVKSTPFGESSEHTNKQILNMHNAGFTQYSERGSAQPTLSLQSVNASADVLRMPVQKQLFHSSQYDGASEDKGIRNSNYGNHSAASIKNHQSDTSSPYP